MTQEEKDDLIKKGRKDLVDTFEINESGYAGILSNGNIVDRRVHPEAIPIPKNELFGISEPKKL